MVKTSTLRALSGAAMAVTGYHLLAPVLNFPGLPSMVTNPLIGNISALTIAAGYTLWSAYQLVTEQI